jgi:hypothetical protein
MKKQTAVELVKQLFFTYAESSWYNDENSWTISNTDFEQIINQALELQEEQIQTAFADGEISDADYFDPAKPDVPSAVNYYNETYKS